MSPKTATQYHDSKCGVMRNAINKEILANHLMAATDGQLSNKISNCDQTVLKEKQWWVDKHVCIELG